jgi:DNA end-binding protein Ku
MHAVWIGAVSFGRVYIPVRMYTASQPRELEFKMLRRGDLCPIRFARLCRDSGEEVPNEDIVRGYEHRPGEYIVLEEADFQRASVEQARRVKNGHDECPAARSRA